MVIEQAGTRFVQKPWGCDDLRPWSTLGQGDAAIGEIWFQRAEAATPVTALLLKLLFTSQPLSIQVHPSDKLARSIGLAHGKSEAWYILSAAPGAEVALGLKRPLSATQLRAAIEDGSIEHAMQTRVAKKDDFIFVPAGTIHAIGKGLVVAEIQQRSDVTFRLFDYDRGRELQIDNAIAAATAGPVASQPRPMRIDDTRSILLASPHFVVERLDLPAATSWLVDASQETWILVLEGRVQVGPVDAVVGDAIYLDAANADLEVGDDDFKCLVTYSGPEPHANLLRPRVHAAAAAMESHV